MRALATAALVPHERVLALKAGDDAAAVPRHAQRRARQLERAVELVAQRGAAPAVELQSATER